MVKSGDVRISRFRVKAYRSCKNTVFSPSRSLTALIGPNGAGKTNILNAIQLLRLSRRRTRSVGDGLQLKCQIEAEFIFGKHIVHFKSRIVVRANETTGDEVIQASEKWNFKNIGWSADWLSGEDASILLQDESSSIAYPIFLRSAARSQRFRYLSRREYLALNSKRSSKEHRSPPKSAKDAFQAIQAFRGRISYYSASQFTKPSSCPTSFEVDEDGDLVEAYRPERQEHTRFISELYQLYRAKSPSYARYLSLVKKSGVGLIDDLKWKDVTFKSTAYEVQSGGKIFNKKRERLLIVPTIHIGKSQLSFNQLSEGTLRTLALLFYIVTDNSSLLLIEEPEVCVHHGLLRSLIEIMSQFGGTKACRLTSQRCLISLAASCAYARIVRSYSIYQRHVRISPANNLARSLTFSGPKSSGLNGQRRSLVVWLSIQIRR